MLHTPDARRALRAVVAAIVTIALVGLVYWIVATMHACPAVLLPIAEIALSIVGLGMLGYITENGIRAMKVRLPGGASAEVQSDAQGGGEGASDTAATIKD